MTEVQPNDFTIHVEYYGKGKEVVYDELFSMRPMQEDRIQEKGHALNIARYIAYLAGKTLDSLVQLMQERGIQWRKNHWKDTTKLLMPIVEELTVENHDLYQDVDGLKNEIADLEAEVEELRSQISWELMKNGGM